MNKSLPILVVLFAMLVLWIVAVAPMNIKLALDQLERQKVEVTPSGSVVRREMSSFVLLAKNAQHVGAAYELDRPKLPTPTQVAQEIWKTTGKNGAAGSGLVKEVIDLSLLGDTKIDLLWLCTGCQHRPFGGYCDCLFAGGRLQPDAVGNH